MIMFVIKIKVESIMSKSIFIMVVERYRWFWRVFSVIFLFDSFKGEKVI